MFDKTLTMKMIIAIFILLVSTVVKADDIDNLVKLIGIDLMLEKAYEECLKGAESLLAEELKIESQSKNLGIDRNHKYWQELEEIYSDFYSVSCEYASEQEAKIVWREVYSKNLSTNEVKELIEFYSSPVGKKIIQLDLKANSTFQEMISKRYAVQALRARRIYEHRINMLMKKLEAEKHNQPFQRTQSLTCPQSIAGLRYATTNNRPESHTKPASRKPFGIFRNPSEWCSARAL